MVIFIKEKKSNWK